MIIGNKGVREHAIDAAHAGFLCLGTESLRDAALCSADSRTTPLGFGGVAAAAAAAVAPQVDGWPLLNLRTT